MEVGRWGGTDKSALIDDLAKNVNFNDFINRRRSREMEDWNSKWSWSSKSAKIEENLK